MFPFRTVPCAHSHCRASQCCLPATRDISLCRKQRQWEALREHGRCFLVITTAIDVWSEGLGIRAASWLLLVGRCSGPDYDVDRASICFGVSSHSAWHPRNSLVAGGGRTPVLRPRPFSRHICPIHGLCTRNGLPIDGRIRCLSFSSCPPGAHRTLLSCCASLLWLECGELLLRRAMVGLLDLEGPLGSLH